MVRKLGESIKFEGTNVETLDKRLAEELEERLELAACPDVYCKTWYHPDE